MPLQQVFMANLKMHRKNAGLTQEKLAEMCSTDPCYIRQIENGRRFPSVAYIERIALALNIPPYRLFFEKSETKPEESEIVNENSDMLTTDQKNKIKTLLMESTSGICSMIDEKY